MTHTDGEARAFLGTGRVCLWVGKGTTTSSFSGSERNKLLHWAETQDVAVWGDLAIYPRSSDTGKTGQKQASPHRTPKSANCHFTSCQWPGLNWSVLLGADVRPVWGGVHELRPRHAAAHTPQEIATLRPAFHACFSGCIGPASTTPGRTPWCQTKCYRSSEGATPVLGTDASYGNSP